MTVVVTSNLVQGGGPEAAIRDSDPIASASPVIEYEHHKNHEGLLFATSTIFNAVADAASAEVVFKTGNLAAHMILEASVGGQSFAYLYEDPTFTAEPADYGTAGLHRRMNRTLAETLGDTGIGYYYGPTLLTDGTILHTQMIPGGGGGPFVFGGSGAGRHEWVLDGGNRIYLFRVTNDSGGAVDMTINGYYYAAANNA